MRVFLSQAFFGFSRNLLSWTWWVVEKSRFTLPKCARSFAHKSYEKTHQPQLLSTISWFKRKHGEGIEGINQTKFTPNPLLHHNQTTTPSTTGICGAKWHTELYPSDDQRHGHLGSIWDNAAGFHGGLWISISEQIFGIRVREVEKGCIG